MFALALLGFLESHFFSAVRTRSLPPSLSNMNDRVHGCVNPPRVGQNNVRTCSFSVFDHDPLVGFVETKALESHLLVQLNGGGVFLVDVES